LPISPRFGLLHDSGKGEIGKKVGKKVGKKDEGMSTRRPGEQENGRQGAAVPAFDPRASPLLGAGEPLPPIVDEALAPGRLRERFLRPPDWQPEMTGDRIRLRTGPPRPAAVLVPIIAHPGAPSVLLTQRTLHLRQHSGQVAFPGGRFEPGDRTPVQTALREAHEEVGLEPQRVEVIGRLPDYLTGTGFLVTPVVGLIAPGMAFRPDPHEVAEVFEVPLAFLMNPRHHEQRSFEVGGVWRTFWAMPYRPNPAAGEYFIWGATAAMLRNLYRFLSA
jgi:8-oxo-dGTP pyrophosphatase MutT (NUDIX family)